MANGKVLDAAEVQSWMVDYVARILEFPKDAISPSATFDALGLDSADAVIMAGMMEERFGVEFEPTLFLERPSIDGVLEFLAANGLVSS